MTNQKVNIEIEDFEDKKSQNGKRYTRFKTSDGWMSAFEKDIIDSLKSNEGKVVTVEIAIDEEKGFKNIRKFIEVAKEQEHIEVIKPSELGKTKMIPQETKVSNTTTMYTSYAKDIFIALISRPNNNTFDANQEMDLAIELVKMARNSFENNGNTKPNTDNKQE